MTSFSEIMNNTLAYRLWQAPFREQKLVPLRNHNDLRKIRAVLDVGCGPGTNTSHFYHSEYVGLDSNPAYIDYARKTHARHFVTTDVCSYIPPPELRFDFIFANSFFHHIDDHNTLQILSKLKTLLTPDGHVHVLDLVLPERRSIARSIAYADRGKFPRSLEKWRSLFKENFDQLVFEPYAVKAFGLTLWNMVYFKGSAK